MSQKSVADPFSEQSSTELYISGRLTLLLLPRGVCGDWTCMTHSSHPHWHRRLTSHAFLWLRSAVNSAIESGKLPDDFRDALESLEQIRQIGIQHGAFTADEVSEGLTAPEWYQFNSGLPAWADEFGASGSDWRVR